MQGKQLNKLGATVEKYLADRKNEWLEQYTVFFANQIIIIN